MSDPPPPPPPPSSGKLFCAECGAAMPADARFCGECGAKPPGAAGAAGPGADPTQVGGASTWQGVAPVVERTEVIPPVPPGAGGPAAGPPPGGPPPGAGGGTPPPPEASKGKSKGPMIAAIVIVLALLAGGAFALLGGGDDEGDDESADIEREEDEDEDEDEDEETTTTTEAEEETTTTTEAADETTTTTEVVDPGLNFLQATDDTGLLVLEVPDFWQLNGAPLGDGSPNIIAAEDLNAFVSGFQSSGVSFTRLPGANVDPNAAIDFLATTNNLFEACTAEERGDYTDGVFTGRQQVFSNCEGSGITLIEIVGSRADGASVEVTMALAPDDSFDIVDRIVATFNLTA